jgi:hypothetical protein
VRCTVAMQRFSCTTGEATIADCYVSETKYSHFSAHQKVRADFAESRQA